MDKSIARKRVLLVVDIHHDLGQQPAPPVLEWLEKNVFPKYIFPKRELVVFGVWKQVASSVPHPYKSYEKWESYNNDLCLNNSRYDFALFMSVKEDRSGYMGIGRQEGWSQRLVTRQLFFATGGNLVCGDWGCLIAGQMIYL